MNNTIYLIVGESSSGKDSVVNKLCDKHGYTKVLSYTTRPQRPNEQNTHTFISDEQFDKLQNIVAYTEFHGYRYAATQELVDNATFYIIDKAGIEYFNANYKGDKDIKIIYIKVLKGVRFERMLRRGESAEQAISRIEHDKIAFDGAEELADFITVNWDLDECVENIYNFMQEQ